MKYYIYNNKEIKIREQAVDTDLFTQYIEMTVSQVAFYLANPNASIDEIKNCQLLPTPPLPTLEDVKKLAISRLSQLSLDTSNSIIPEYRIRNAMMTISHTSIDNSIYSQDEASQIISDANNIGTLCRNKFYELKKSIESATTDDEVYEIEQEGIDEYNRLTTEYEKTL